MAVKIFESEFKGAKSLIMENDFLKVVILPYGGRVVSLYNKANGREFLLQQDTPAYTVDRYAGDYVGFNPCGFDDMFPTINECFYESYPWKGHVMPDHGEVWGLDWHYRIEDGRLIMDTYGIRLPYRLIKSFLFYDNGKKLHIDYSAENPTGFDMSFLWAAHPILKAEEGMEFYLPSCCTKAVSVLSAGISDRIGGFGEELDWPVARDLKGVSHQLNKVRNSRMKIAEKYYFKNRLEEGWVRIKYPSDGAILKLSFPPEKVPYLGILLDEGWWKDNLVYMIPEPCTAAFDSIALSKVYSMDSVIKSCSKYEWFLEFGFE